MAATKSNGGAGVTEKDMILKAARRLGVLNEEFTEGNEAYIESYYDLVVCFDDKGKIAGFGTHP